MTSEHSLSYKGAVVAAALVVSLAALTWSVVAQSTRVDATSDSPLTMSTGKIQPHAFPRADAGR